MSRVEPDIALRKGRADSLNEVRRSGAGFPTTRLTLIGRLRGDAGGAWDTFFRIYGPVVYRMARHAGLSSERADEVVAYVMRKFWGAVKGGFEVNHDVGLLRNYLRTITNQAIRSEKGRRTAGEGSDSMAIENAPSREPAPDDIWERTEQEERLLTCLERLRESRSVRTRDVQAFEEYVLQGRRPAEVAKRYQITENRLFGIKHEIIKKLRTVARKLDRELGEV